MHDPNAETYNEKIYEATLHLVKNVHHHFLSSLIFKGDSEIRQKIGIEGNGGTQQQPIKEVQRDHRITPRRNQLPEHGIGEVRYSTGPTPYEDVAIDRDGMQELKSQTYSSIHSVCARDKERYSLQTSSNKQTV